MDRETERVVRELVKEETREEAALILVNLRQMNAAIDTLQKFVKELEEAIKPVSRSARPSSHRYDWLMDRRADGPTRGCKWK
jgi:uncharacterized protein YlxW (UPF0749 family)